MSDEPAPCFVCGYDLRGVPAGGICPECGSPRREVREVIDFQAARNRRLRWLAGAIVLGVIAVFIGVVSWLALVAY